MRTEIPVPTERLDEFCRRWKIAELRVFGSGLREDFRPDSDLDLLVRFGRKVDLVSERAIERSSNWIRRKAILASADPYFASR